MKIKGLNTQRILLTTLVAVSFSGFLLWSIAQSQEEQEILVNESALAKNGMVSNKVILITLPITSSTIGNPVTISATAKEGAYKIKIKDTKGLVLSEATAQVKKGQTAFSLSLKYKKASTSAGSIEIFKPGDNNMELYKLSVPILFKK
jgi:hypothetical protein